MFEDIIKKLKSALVSAKDLALKGKKQLAEKSNKILQDTNLKEKIQKGKEKLVEKSKELKGKAEGAWHKKEDNPQSNDKAQKENKQPIDKSNDNSKDESKNKEE